MADLTSAITGAAGLPAAAETKAGSVTQQPLGDLIEADRYLANKDAAARAGSSIFAGAYVGKALPPGSIEPSPDF